MLPLVTFVSSHERWFHMDFYNSYIFSKDIEPLRLFLKVFINDNIEEIRMKIQNLDFLIYSIVYGVTFGHVCDIWALLFGHVCEILSVNCLLIHAWEEQCQIFSC